MKASNHGHCEEIAAEPIKSVNATILQINGRILTIRFPSTPVVALAGKDIEINGAKAAWVQSLPSSEAEDEKIDVTNALLFRIAEQVVPSSIKVASICEVTWE
jgi:hypothetical protein